MSSIIGSVIFASLAAALFALAVTPRVIRLAHLIGAVDQPNERKTHARPMPRLGGVAVLASFAFSLVVLRLGNPVLFSSIWKSNQEALALGIALFLMLVVGIWDDIKTLGPGRKFVAQWAIATFVYAAGFSIKIISFPNTEGHVDLNIFDYIVTTFWIIGVTNAVNLIDGLDGLASGVATIACLTIAPIAFLNSDLGTAVIAILLAGALLGFLRYNFNPAKIFLGDSGSLVLGLALAVLSIRSSTKATTAFALIIPVLALGLPIMETLLSMVRRFLRSVSPWSTSAGSFTSKLKGMFLPDKSHIHHRLIAAGFSHRHTVLILYVVSCFLGVGAFALSVAHDVTSSLILAVMGTAAILGIKQLKYTEMAVLKNGVLLPLYDRDILNRETFRAFIDISFVILSFFLAQVIMHWGSPDHIFGRGAIATVSIVCAIQFIVLWMSGLYNESIRHIGLREVVRITKGVAQAVIATGLLFAFVINPQLHVNAGTMVLDFYLLLTFVMGSRVSFSILKHLSQSPAKEGRRVLLYGAGMNGKLVLDRILNGKLPDLVPVGFLDDDPYLEGKRINGYTVFGGHWQLQRLLNKFDIDEVLLVSEQIKPEILRRLDSMTKSAGLRLRKLNLTLEELSQEEFVRPLPDPLPAERPWTFPTASQGQWQR